MNLPIHQYLPGIGFIIMMKKRSVMVFSNTGRAFMTLSDIIIYGVAGDVN